jgi:hypothetical protein
MKLKYFTWYLDDEAERPYYYNIVGKKSNGDLITLMNWEGKWDFGEIDLDPNSSKSIRPEDIVGERVKKLDLKIPSKRALVRFIFNRWQKEYPWN